MSNKSKKSVLLLTTLPFNIQGNQSLKRFIKMFTQRGITVNLVGSGPENVCNLKKVNLYPIKYPFTSSIKKFKPKKISSKKKEGKNFFEQIKSENLIKTYGAHDMSTAVRKWLLFVSRIIDNIYLFLIFLTYKKSVVKEANLIIGYECGLSLAAKLLSLAFKKPYINKYQGAFALRSLKNNLIKSMVFYPHFYFGLNKSDLCIMVNDGTRGDYYAKKKGCDNIYFEPHGVAAKEYLNKPIQKLKLKNNFSYSEDKFLIFNNASGILAKRPDRVIRSLQYIDNNILQKIIFLTTYYGYKKQELIEYTKMLGLENNVFFLEKINYLQSNQLIRNSDVLIMTNEVSNLGNPVLEAIYFGVPVISIADGSLDGFVTHNKDGILIKLDEDFDKNLAESIEMLVRNKDFYDKLKNNMQLNNSVNDLETQQKKEFDTISKFLRNV